MRFCFAAPLAIAGLLTACNEAPKSTPEDTGPAAAGTSTAGAPSQRAPSARTPRARSRGNEAAAWPTLSGTPPLIIAHRGASGARPEHTLAAYELAIDQGADFIEPDLVMTKDGVLVARHDRFLSTTTDIADRPEFANRKRIQETPAGPRHDWWAEDFTLEEIKTLRAVQPRGGRSDEFDGQFDIPTFQEVIDLAKARSTDGRVIGIYPETKSPGHHKEVGLDMEPPLLAALEQAGWTGADAPVFVQSFEPGILQSLDGKIDTPLVMLVYGIPGEEGALAANVPMDSYAGFADGVGPQKTLVITPDGEATDFIARAHAAGLAVHPWTFRDDDPPADGVDIKAELTRVFEAGADGVFTDFPDTAISVRNSMAEAG